MMYRYVTFMWFWKWLILLMLRLQDRESCHIVSQNVSTWVFHTIWLCSQGIILIHLEFLFLPDLERLLRCKCSRKKGYLNGQDIHSFIHSSNHPFIHSLTPFRHRLSYKCSRKSVYLNVLDSCGNTARFSEPLFPLTQNCTIHWVNWRFRSTRISVSP